MGIVPFAADESYEAVILEDSCAALLGVPSGSCAFFHQRLTRTEDGRIYEYTRSYIRGDRVRLDVHMQKSGMNFVRTIDCIEKHPRQGVLFPHKATPKGRGCAVYDSSRRISTRAMA